MNQQQKRKNQKKHRDNMHKAFMEAFKEMSPKPLRDKPNKKIDKIVENTRQNAIREIKRKSGTYRRSK